MPKKAKVIPLFPMPSDEELLNHHNFRLWEDMSGRWCTYIHDPISGLAKRRTRETREQLEQYLIRHYRKQWKEGRIPPVKPDPPAPQTSRSEISYQELTALLNILINRDQDLIDLGLILWLKGENAIPWLRLEKLKPEDLTGDILKPGPSEKPFQVPECYRWVLRKIQQKRSPGPFLFQTPQGPVPTSAFRKRMDDLLCTMNLSDGPAPPGGPARIIPMRSKS